MFSTPCIRYTAIHCFSGLQYRQNGVDCGGWKYAAAPNCTGDHRGTGERAANLDTRRPVVPLGGCKTLRDT